MATPPPLPQSEKGATATMINPTTGHKVAVVGGGTLSHNLFGQGYYLMGKDGKAVGYTPPAGAGGTNGIINSNQQTDFNSAYGDPTLRSAIDKAATSFFDNLQTPPPIYNSSEYYRSLIGDQSSTNPDGLGITALEGHLNELTAQEQQLQQTARERTAQNVNKPVSMGVIGGRQGEIDRQTNVQLNDIAVQKAPVVSALQTKYQMVNTLMNLKQTDYTNAVSSYENSFNNAVSTINTLRGLNQDVITAQQQAQSAASANLSIVFNSINTGALDYAHLDAGTKATISKLEVQAGLPIGFTAKLHSTNPKQDIIATTQRTDPSGNDWADVVMRGRDGKITVQHVSLGQSAKKKSTTNNSSTTTNSDTTGVKPNLGGGKVTKNDVGGLSFTDKKGNPITAAQYATNTKKNLIKVLGDSGDSGDAGVVSDLNDVVTKVKKGAINPGTGKKYTAADAYGYAQSSYDWIFNGVSQAQFKQIMGI